MQTLTTIEVKLFHPEYNYFIQSVLLAYTNLPPELAEREARLHVYKYYPNTPYKMELIKTK